MDGEREGGHDVQRGEEYEVVGEDAKSKRVLGTCKTTLTRQVFVCGGRVREVIIINNNGLGFN